MGKRIGVLVTLIVVLAAAAGCHARKTGTVPGVPLGTKSPASLGPMDVTLWDGETLRGPVEWRADGTVAVGRREISQDRIRVMQAVPSGPAGTVEEDVSKLPEPMRPLSDAKLAEYRKRAQEAAAKYKGVDNILCLDLGEDVLQPDGTQVYRYHALHLIVKDTGRGVANVSVGSSMGRSRARVLYARSISPEGQSRWSGKDTFNESVPPESEQFVNARARLLSGQAPGADVDMLVEYAYEQELYNPEVKDFFFPGYVFQSDKPVLDSVIDVLVPEGRKLNYAAFHMPKEAAEPKVSKRDGYDVYRWELQDAPVITSEPAMPDMSDVVARVECSLFFDWPQLMDVTGKFQEERIKVTPDVKEAAEKITAGKTADDEKVAAIYHWVQRNINYLSVKASLASGWAGHPAGETLKAGYGDCTDVSNLMATLCRAVGVDAYPVDIKTNEAGRAVTEIPVPDQNHAIVLVYINGKPRFLDPTSEDFRYPYFRSDDHGVKAIVSIKHEIMDIPVPPPEDNMRESRQEITLAPDGSAEAVEHNAYTGTYEASVRGFWRSVPPEMRGKIMQQSLQSRSPGSSVESFKLGELQDLSQQLKMELTYSIPSLATRMKDLYILTLPNFKQTFPEAALEQRKFDIEAPSTMEYDTEVKVAIPAGYTIAGTPEPLALHGKHLWFEGSVERDADGKTLIAKQVFKRLTRVVPVADYEQYRKDAAAIASWSELKLVLQKEAAPAGQEVTQ